MREVEEAFERALRAVAAKAQPRAELDAVARLSGALNAALDDVQGVVLRQLTRHGRVPTGVLQQKQLESLILRAAQGIAPTMRDLALAAAVRGRKQVVAALDSSFDFDAFPRQVMQRIGEHVFTATESTTRRMVGDVMGALGQAAEQGLGIDDASVLLRDRFQGMKDYELKRIARTEIQGFQNEGIYETERLLGVEYHQWVSAGDERVRESHEEVAGEIVATGESFSNGMRYPLDRDNAPIEEWVNCRCRAVPFIISPDKAAPGPGPFRESDLIQRKPDPEDKKREVVAVREDTFSAQPDGTETLRLPSTAEEYRQMESPAEEDARFINAFQTPEGEFALDLPPDQRDAHITSLRTYQGSDFERINDAHRLNPDRLDVEGLLRREDDSVREVSKRLDTLIEAAPRVPEDVEVFRGIEGSYANVVRDAPPGTVLGDRGYLSTTVDRGAAADFSDFGSGREMRIQVPQGAQGVYMNANPTSMIRGEYELLLARGAQLEVLEQTDSHTLVRLVGYVRGALG